MNRFVGNNVYKRAASLLITFGMALGQLPAYAQAMPLGAQMPAPPPAEAVAGNQASQAPTLIAQATPGTTVLQGSVSNVDTLSKDILRDEIKLEKYSLNYRLNAAKQGRWKGWRYFFFQETALTLTEVGLIQTIAYRGKHLHQTTLPAPFTGTRHHNRGNILANDCTMPSVIAGIVSGSSDVMELSINMWHKREASKAGFSQSQSRRYIAGVIADIDKKLALREAAIRQEPPADSELGQLQALEGKVLSDFRDSSIAEFERYHIGASRVMMRENSFYLLDMANKALLTTAFWMVMDSQIRVRPRMAGTTQPMLTVQSGLTMIDPILSRWLGALAAKHDRHVLQHDGMPRLALGEGKLRADYSQMKGFAASHRTSDKPEVQAAEARMDAYDANNAFYVNEEKSETRTNLRGQRFALQNVGMGLLVGGSSLPGRIDLDYLVQYHQHQRAAASFVKSGPFKGLLIGPGTATNQAGITTPRLQNEGFFLGAVISLPANSIAILDSIGIRLSGEVAYQQQKRNHTLPAQLVRARLAQLDKVQAKI